MTLKEVKGCGVWGGVGLWGVGVGVVGGGGGKWNARLTWLM